MYLFSEMIADYSVNAYLWSQHSIVTDFIPECTDIESRLLRAFHSQTKKQIILLSSGIIHFIT